MTKQKNIPPKSAKWLLKRLLTKQNNDSVIGDFEEIYNEVLHSKGVLFAFFWYWFQIFVLIPSLYYKFMARKFCIQNRLEYYGFPCFGNNINFCRNYYNKLSNDKSGES